MGLKLGMRKIDYIYKYFDPVAFAKDLKKKTKSPLLDSGSFFLTSIVLGSVRDINQIKREINRYQFSKNNPKNVFSKFVKKFKNNYSDKDLEKYFFEKENFLNTGIDEDECSNLLDEHVNCGEFLEDLKVILT